MVFNNNSEIQENKVYILNSAIQVQTVKHQLEMTFQDDDQAKTNSN